MLALDELFNVIGFAAAVIDGVTGGATKDSTVGFDVIWASFNIKSLTSRLLFFEREEKEGSVSLFENISYYFFVQFYLKT